MEVEILTAPKKNLGGRPRTYPNKEIQIVESQRKIKINRCINDIERKYIKLFKFINEEEKANYIDKIKNIINSKY